MTSGSSKNIGYGTLTAKSCLSFTLVRISRPASLLFPFLSLTKFSVVSNNFELSRLKIKPIAFFLTSAVFNLSASSISLAYLVAKLLLLLFYLPHL